MLKRNSIFIGLLFLLAMLAFANPLAAYRTRPPSVVPLTASASGAQPKSRGA